MNNKGFIEPVAIFIFGWICVMGFLVWSTHVEEMENKKVIVQLAKEGKSPDEIKAIMKTIKEATK